MKFFLQSKTVIGILIPVLIQLLPLLGVSFSAEDGQLISNFADQAISLVSLGFALYGRFVAKEPLSVLPQ